MIRRFKDLSIRGKLMLIALVVGVSAVLVSSFVSIAYDLSALRRRTRDNVLSRTQELAAVCDTALIFDDKDEGSNNLAGLQADEQIISVALFDATGRIFASYERPWASDEEARLTDEPQGARYSSDYLTAAYPVVDQGGVRIGNVVVRSDLQVIKQRLRDHLKAAGFAIALAFALTVALSARLQRLVSRPILELSQTARIIAHGRDYATRAKKRGDDEIGHTVDSFNEMLSEIQERDARLQRAQADLEERVAQRTQELSTANEQLRDQMERRMLAEEEQRKLAFLVQNSADFIGMASLEGRALFLNQAGRRLVEIDLDADITEYTLTDFHTRESLAEYFDEIQPAVKERGMWQGQSVLRRMRSNTAVPVHRSVFMIRNPSSGEPICYATVTRDISEQLDLEAQLRQSQKMEAVGQLAAGVAHDFNNILTIIQGNATLIEAGRDPMAGDNPPAHMIGEAVKRASNLTRQLLTFSRKQVIQPRPLNLNEVVRNVSRLLTRTLGEHIDLQLNFGPNLPLVDADEGMLEQVITNLAVNARNAMPKGGKLSIGATACAIDESERRHPGARSGQFVKLFVEDTGRGMDAATLERIFEPFFTTKEVGKGTGLGLATVYGIARQHDGWVEVRSEVDEGTTFEVFVPVTDKTAAAATDTVSDTEICGNGERILLVEDEPALLQLLTEILATYGYSVLEASNGADAIRVWNQHKDEIDLLLTDLVMPGGMSGRDLAEQLCQDRPGLKVLYTSGYSVDAAGEDFVLQEGVNFIGKPYRPAAVAAAISKCLEDDGPGELSPEI